MGTGPEARSRLKRLRPYIALGAVVALGAGAAVAATMSAGADTSAGAFAGYTTPQAVSKTLYDNGSSTPIKHLVVIFDENVSFDHYFATYPNALNPAGEPAFHARRGTPTVNGLSAALLTNNPNALNPANGAGATNPFRLDRSQAATA